MDISTIIILIIFINGIIAISFEHVLGVNKSWIAIFTGTSMWMVASFGAEPEAMNEALEHGFVEIFELIVFLIGAMTIVEMMGHYRFFSWIENKLISMHISNYQLFWILGFIAFVTSSVLDNLTSTLVMLQVGRHLYIKKENFNLFVINTILAANAGGVMSPVGDVTTIMLWLDGKFTAWEIFFFGLLPAITAWIIPQYLLTRKMVVEKRIGKEVKEEIAPLKWYIIFIGLMTFGLAVLVNMLHLPPLFGILFGLGIAAITIDYRLKRGKLVKKANKIVNVIRSIDMATIIFFIGILLAVHALGYIGVLNQIAHFLFGENPGENGNTIIVGHTVLGIISSVFDNVPLTAAVLEMLPNGIEMKYWILLAITAGTGGSILIIGSAAGVAAMGQVPDLSVTEYVKKGTIPAIIGYFAAIAVWYLQFEVFGKALAH